MLVKLFRIVYRLYCKLFSTIKIEAIVLQEFTKIRKLEFVFYTEYNTTEIYVWKSTARNKLIRINSGCFY